MYASAKHNQHNGATCARIYLYTLLVFNFAHSLGGKGGIAEELNGNINSAVWMRSGGRNEQKKTAQSEMAQWPR